jgi:hypothetical protein
MATIVEVIWFAAVGSGSGLPVTSMERHVSSW